MNIFYHHKAVLMLYSKAIYYNMIKCILENIFNCVTFLELEIKIKNY